MGGREKQDVRYFDLFWLNNISFATLAYWVIRDEGTQNIHLERGKNNSEWAVCSLPASVRRDGRIQAVAARRWHTDSPETVGTEQGLWLGQQGRLGSQIIQCQRASGQTIQHSQLLMDHHTLKPITVKEALQDPLKYHACINSLTCYLASGSLTNRQAKTSWSNRQLEIDNCVQNINVKDKFSSTVDKEAPTFQTARVDVPSHRRETRSKA